MNLDKASALAESEGFVDPMELAFQRGLDSVQPGICTNKGCNYTTEVEPDCVFGWCPECGDGSVASIGILMDLL